MTDLWHDEFKTFIKELDRLHNLLCRKNGCEGCELHEICNRTNRFTECFELIICISEKHPVKTFLDDFKEKHPNAIMSCNGKPKACRRLLYGGSCREDRDCLKCWKEEINE